MRESIQAIFIFIGKFLSFLFPFRLSQIIKWGYLRLYSGWLIRGFDNVGKNALFTNPIRQIEGRQYITIGNKVNFGKNLVLTAVDNYGIQTFKPRIIIGSNCAIGDDAHITAINGIFIGNNVTYRKKNYYYR